VEQHGELEDGTWAAHDQVILRPAHKRKIAAKQREKRLSSVRLRSMLDKHPVLQRAYDLYTTGQATSYRAAANIALEEIEKPTLQYNTLLSHMSVLDFKGIRDAIGERVEPIKALIGREAAEAVNAANRRAAEARQSTVLDPTEDANFAQAVLRHIETCIFLTDDGSKIAALWKARTEVRKTLTALAPAAAATPMHEDDQEELERIAQQTSEYVPPRQPMPPPKQDGVLRGPLADEIQARMAEQQAAWREEMFGPQTPPATEDEE